MLLGASGCTGCVMSLVWAVPLCQEEPIESSTYCQSLFMCPF